MKILLKLKIGENGSKKFKWKLKPNNTYIIGRKKKYANIVIKNPTIDKKHAKIEIGKNGHQVILTDL